MHQNLPTFAYILPTKQPNLPTKCLHYFSANAYFKGLCSKFVGIFAISIHTRKEIQMKISYKKLLANIGKMDFKKQCKAKIAGKRRENESIL